MDRSILHGRVVAVLAGGIIAIAGTTAIASAHGKPATKKAHPVHVNGTKGADTITGTEGNDRLNGRNGDDTINGLGGNDRIHGGNGNDTIDAGAGDDTVFGGNGADDIKGGDGNDRIHAGNGKDTIDGGAGDDHIHARDGKADDITCGDGEDWVKAYRKDTVAADCEHVKLAGKAPAPAATPTPEPTPTA